MKTAVVASWETIASRHATIGDHLAVGVVVDALQRAGVAVRRATSVDMLPAADAASTRIWVCGPVDFSYAKQQDILGATGEGWTVSGASVIDAPSLAAVRADLSTVRDGPGHRTKADFATLAPRGHKAAIASVLLRGHQPEYRQTHATHVQVADAVAAALASTGHYPVGLDTVVPGELDPLSASATLEALLAMSDVVITSRLHGIIHSVRAGKYPVVIDEVVAGGKVSACAREFSIPVLSLSPSLSDEIVALIAFAKSRSTGDVEALDQRMRQSASSNLTKLVSIVTQGTQQTG